MLAGVAFQPLLRGLFPRHLRAANASFLCTHRSGLRPRQYRPERAKNRSKKLCKIVHYCAFIKSTKRHVV
ncbi:hypothetical protein C2013_13970 [Salmonella enterica]|uniref:Uncharacterized protein n=1 Tax=Salmonella enterica subsp. houtenae serovar 44:z36[z38]:- TaxID=1967609 RepID=A0A736MJF3_SALHO|nr:hypothetical protein [Salmonella enterica]EAW2520148.1 hypothetical protein [Salmonella enterica subsp. enterica]EBD0059376.1 hypothetical protein [Salmonella enterica subsp. enterica serovar Newport]EBH8638330.1 hypothetical protein [Salmonella enterica subsp. enterica serovar Thompson]ECS7700736.1 hypothetical protein [Salmonella enterica subsp. enterica serovar Javiana]EDU0268057.1 hypothetical protein [Salmonella enterica subsp. enterica serovar Glostrup]HAE7582900.1 hypothetical prote